VRDGVKKKLKEKEKGKWRDAGARFSGVLRLAAPKKRVGHRGGGRRVGDVNQS